jgi:dihydrofolate reductase
MRKLVVYNMVSVDGYFAGKDGDISWHTVDDEFNQFAIETLSQVDTIIFGRTTYQLFEGYWPRALVDPQTNPANLVIAQAIDNAKKIVFSKSLESVTWHNSQLEHEISPDKIKQLKAESGKDIIIYGSGAIVRQLTKLDLIDEYRFIISPTILGAGETMFEGAHQTPLNLVATRSFVNGNLLVVYAI